MWLYNMGKAYVAHMSTYYFLQGLNYLYSCIRVAQLWCTVLLLQAISGDKRKIAKSTAFSFLLSGNAEIQKVEFRTRLNTNSPEKGRKNGGLNRKEWQPCWRAMLLHSAADMSRRMCVFVGRFATQFVFIFAKEVFSPCF